MKIVSWHPNVNAHKALVSKSQKHTTNPAYELSGITPQFAGNQHRVLAALLVTTAGFLSLLLPKHNEQKAPQPINSPQPLLISPANNGPIEQSFKRMNISPGDSKALATLFPLDYKGPVQVLHSEPFSKSPDYIPVGPTQEATAALHKQIAALRKKHTLNYYDAPTIAFKAKVLPDKPPTRLTASWPTQLLLITSDVLFDSMRSEEP